MRTIVIVYDRSGGERTRWEDGPVPREGEYVRERYGKKLVEKGLPRTPRRAGA